MITFMAPDNVIKAKRVPLKPNPRLVGNYEGNKRAVKRAQRYIINELRGRGFHREADYYERELRLKSRRVYLFLRGKSDSTS